MQFDDIEAIATTRILPVLLHAHYTADDSYTGRVAFLPNSTAGMWITILHDSQNGTASYEVPGQSAQPLLIAVHNGDGLVVLCRYEGEIVASAVCQVEFRLVEEVESLLAPLSLCNIIIDQHSAEPAIAVPTTGEIAAIKLNIDKTEANVNAILEAVKAIEVRA